MKNFLAYLLVLCTLASPAAFAQGSMPLHAEEILQSNVPIRHEIETRLQNPEFVQKLDKIGVSKKEVELRIAGMTDQELAQVQAGVQRQVGGEVVVIGLTTLLIIILVILLVRG